MAVRVDLNISLDGVAAPADPTPENPMGADWGRLVEDYMATRTFRTRVFGDTSGAGTTGIDDRYAAAYFEGVGAEVMGAAMFGLHSFPDDPEWRGWWGDEPPFRVPVIVLTHRPREPIAFANGTRFEFSSESITDAVGRAAISPTAPTCAWAAGCPPCAPLLPPESSTACTWRCVPSSWAAAVVCGMTSPASTPATPSPPRSRRAVWST